MLTYWKQLILPWQRECMEIGLMILQFLSLLASLERSFTADLLLNFFSLFWSLYTLLQLNLLLLFASWYIICYLQGWKSCAVTTLGRGGSDLTATTIGKALGLREIQVYIKTKCIKNRSFFYTCIPPHPIMHYFHFCVGIDFWHFLVWFASLWMNI